jgi:tetratricopeptide (TPR) repeat protein
MRLALFLLFALAAPVRAQDGFCPALPDRTAQVDAIYSDIARAGGAAEAQFLSNQLWQIWLAAPDSRAQALLDQGMERRARGDFAGSIAILDELVAYCPDYAEGWNQRAFAAFLARDFAAALPDIDAALSREPRHLGAMTGKALTLFGLGRDDEAQEVLRAAVALNPFLAERALITEPPGEDI